MTSDIIFGYTDYLSIYISGMSVIISVDSILILLFLVESPSSITVIRSFSKLWSSVDRRSSMMSILWLETIIYFTTYVIELICNSLLVLRNDVMLY